MREIRLYGSEGGGAERLFLPLLVFDESRDDECKVSDIGL